MGFNAHSNCLEILNNLVFDLCFLSESWWNSGTCMHWELRLLAQTYPASHPHHTSLPPLLGGFSTTFPHTVSAAILSPQWGIMRVWVKAHTPQTRSGQVEVRASLRVGCTHLINLPTQERVWHHIENKQAYKQNLLQLKRQTGGKEKIFFSNFWIIGLTFSFFPWSSNYIAGPDLMIYHFTSYMILGKSLCHSKFVFSSLNCGFCFLLHMVLNENAIILRRNHRRRRKHNELPSSLFIHGYFWF